MSHDIEQNTLRITDAEHFPAPLKSGEVTVAVYPSSPTSGLATVYAPTGTLLNTDDVRALRDFLTLALVESGAELADDDDRCRECLDHPGWATGDESRRRHSADYCRACLGSGVRQEGR